MKKIFRNSALVLAVLACCGSALAGNDNSNGGCQGNCPTTGGTTNNAGGAGGAGGSAYAGAIAGAAAGAAVVGSGNSSVGVNNSNRNDNSNTNVNANNVSSRNENSNSNRQGQAQGQQQQQSNRSANSNNNNVGATGSGNATNVGGQKLEASLSVGGDTVIYKAAEIPVATAYAAPLTASNGTCMGSSSAGGQGMQFGVSFGTTWTDNDCDRRYDANVLLTLGDKDAARALMLQKPSVKAAYDSLRKTAGDQAPARKAAAEVEQQPQQVAYTDPIIRARLGLPPLK